ncbi:MAG TPA: protein kinase [Thermoanaerobaculia bacterium]|nr:protein kinase [Thermoanaerobaculia bacterium]
MTKPPDRQRDADASPPEPAGGRFPAGGPISRAPTLESGGAGSERSAAPEEGVPSGPRFVPGQVLAGRYRIVSRLGQGGMSEVYRAQDLKLLQEVALKFLRQRREEDGRRRAAFLNEIRLARRISHPNVCRVFDLGEVDGVPFLSMEHVDGEDLASLLHRIGRLPRDKALEIGRQVCEGLAAAHELGILHRDLKPANLMVDSHGRARVTDFGLAVLADQATSRARSRGGTPAYMAPEQAAGVEVSVQSDLYSLGLVLFELLTGEQVSEHRARQPTRLDAEAGPEDDGEPTAAALRALPPSARQIIAQCLEKDPRLRPASAETVARALDPGVGLGEGARIAALVAIELAGADGSELSVSGVDSAALGRVERQRGDLLGRFGGRALDSGEGPVYLFERPWAAVRFALEHQRVLAEDGILSEHGGAGGLTLRCAIHLEEVVLRREEAASTRAAALRVTGLGTSLVTRLRSIAMPGQTLMTRAAFEVARRGAVGAERSTRLSWLAHGEYDIKGVDEPVEVFEVGAVGRAPLQAPAGSGEFRRTGAQDTILGWRPAPSLPIPHRPHWIVQRKLGEGGFGEVWLVRHAKTHELRVFKFCYEKERLRSLQREVTLFRLLKEELGDRDDIARLLDWSLDQAPYFIEFAYTEEGSLVDWSARRGGIAGVPLGDRLDVAIQVATALSAAHSVGVLHKDVKPANVLLSEDVGGRLHAALTDFGIGTITERARLEARGITVQGLTEVQAGDGVGTTTGTHLYMAPELLAGRPASIQADLYALGVTLYQLVVGDFERPLAPGWERDVDDELLREDIANLVDGDPDRRPRSALELAERLESLDQRREERARQRRALREAERSARRRRLFGIVAVVATVFLVVVSILAVQAQRAREDAERRSEQAEQLINFMLDDLYDGLERIARLDLLEQVSRSSQDYFAGLTARDETSSAAGQRGRMMLHVGDVLAAGGDAEGAVVAYRSAVDAFRAASERQGDRPELRAGLLLARVQLGAALGRQGNTEDARAVLEAVVDELGGSEARDPDGGSRSSELDYGAALARYELSAVHRKIGDTGSAVAELRDAIRLASSLVGPSGSGDWRSWRLLVDSRLALAEALQINGEHEQAQRQLELALAEAERLAREDPANATWSRRVAVIHSAAGFGSFLVGDLEAAASSLESATEAYRSLMRSDAARVEWREKLARDLRVLGTVETERGDPSSALALLDEARRLLDDLVSADPTVVRHRESLARAYWAISLAHQARSELTPALEAKLESHALLEELWRSSGDPGPRNELAYSHVAIGDLRLQLGHHEQALDDWSRAVELVEPIVERSPETQYLDTYAQALLKLGRLERARPVVEELLGRGWRDPVFLETVRGSGLPAP